MRRILVHGAAALVLALPACHDLPSESAPDALAPQEPALSFYGVGDVVRAVPRPCPDPAADGFDFWVGQWNVYNPAGTQIATSVISSELDGCVVMEDYLADGGYRGRSLSAYDAATGTWHQLFQDNVLGNWRLAGEVENGSMVMHSDQVIYHFGIGDFVHRVADVTWTPTSATTVRQFFEGSFDGGPVQTLFDGRYVAADELDRATPGSFPFCESVLPGYRQLDFWIGEWSAEAASGPAVGSATVRSDLNGCLMIQELTGRNGYRARSYMVYDFPTDVWFRYLADNAGDFVKLSGGLDGGRMVLTGTDEAEDGRTFHVRDTIEPVAGGVLETWETSPDGDRWTTSLTVRYSAP